MAFKFLSIAVSMALAVVMDAKKITKDFLESEIAEVKYQRLSGTLTHCTIITHDGFTFTGESACVDSAQFDEEIGKKIAYQQAFDKMWMPYGFWLHKTMKLQNQPEEGENWYQEQYVKIGVESGLSEDAPAEDMLEELTEGIEYTTKCMVREDLVNLLGDNNEAIAVVKDYFKDLVIVDGDAD